jgi:hypothetical protein
MIVVESVNNPETRFRIAICFCGANHKEVIGENGTNAEIPCAQPAPQMGFEIRPLTQLDMVPGVHRFYSALTRRAQSPKPRNLRRPSLKNCNAAVDRLRRLNDLAFEVVGHPAAQAQLDQLFWIERKVARRLAVGRPRGARRCVRSSRGSNGCSSCKRTCGLSRRYRFSTWSLPRYRLINKIMVVRRCR